MCGMAPSTGNYLVQNASSAKLQKYCSRIIFLHYWAAHNFTIYPLCTPDSQSSPWRHISSLLLQGEVRFQLQKDDFCSQAFGFVLFLSISGCLLAPFSLLVTVAWPLVLEFRGPSGMLSHSSDILGLKGEWVFQWEAGLSSALASCGGRGGQPASAALDKTLYQKVVCIGSRSTLTPSHYQTQSDP